MSRRASSNGNAPSSGDDDPGTAALSAAAPPAVLGDIPGLGPIRVRALQKAGLATLGSLRSAGLKTLMAVPGLTEIKARQIQEFLEPYSESQLSAASLAAAEARNAEGVPAADSVSPADASFGAAQLVQRAARAMGEVITVLLSPEAPQFRSRFLRILGQFALAAESLATDAVHLSDEQRTRAIRRLRRATKALSELSGSSAADRKAQGRVADALEELTAKLADCRLS